MVLVVKNVRLNNMANIWVFVNTRFLAQSITVLENKEQQIIVEINDSYVVTFVYAKT